MSAACPSYFISGLPRSASTLLAAIPAAQLAGVLAASSPGGGLGTHDTLLLKGITRDHLMQNTDDIAFHG